MLIDPHPCDTLAQRRITYLITHHENKGGSGFDADAFKHDYQRAKRVCAAASTSTESAAERAARRERDKRDIAEYERRERARHAAIARQREERARILREKRTRRDVVWGGFDTTPTAPAPAHAAQTVLTDLTERERERQRKREAREANVLAMGVRKGKEEQARKLVELMRKIRARK